MDAAALRGFRDSDAEVPPVPEEEAERSVDRHEPTPEALVEAAERWRRGDWVEEADRPPDVPIIM